MTDKDDAPAPDALIAELRSLCHSALVSNPVLWGRADYAKLFRAVDQAADALAALTAERDEALRKYEAHWAGRALFMDSVRAGVDEANDRAEKAEAALAERDKLLQQAMVCIPKNNEAFRALRDAIDAAPAAPGDLYD